MKHAPDFVTLPVGMLPGQKRERGNEANKLTFCPE